MSEVLFSIILGCLLIPGVTELPLKYPGKGRTLLNNLSDPVGVRPTNARTLEKITPTSRAHKIATECYTRGKGRNWLGGPACQSMGGVLSLCGPCGGKVEMGWRGKEGKNRVGPRSGVFAQFMFLLLFYYFIFPIPFLPSPSSNSNSNSNSYLW
jgi:hypothetical protein